MVIPSQAISLSDMFTSKTFTLSVFILTLLFLVTPLQADAQVAIQGETVYTMAGDPIEDGVVLIREGKIERIGPADEVEIPAGYDVHEAAVVTPGLIDARSVVGLAGILNIEDDQDQLDTASPLQPDLRAVDAYDAREELVGWLRNLGITTVHTGHAPSALISGQTMIAKTSGQTVSEAVVDSLAMVSFTLGPQAGAQFSSPGTRSKGAAMLREYLLRAEDYRDGMEADDPADRPSRNLEMEIMSKVLNGEVPALIAAHEVPEIMTALRLQEEFGFDMVLDGGVESYLLLDELREADIPVITHAPMIRTAGPAGNAAFDTPAKLQEAGLDFAFQSGFEGYVPKTRVVLFEAGVAVQNGLDFDDALRALTINAAALLGIADRVGSLEEGKDADVVLFDGDPFEYVTRVCGVFIDGEHVSDSCK